MRWYFHIDMDAFFVSVERVFNPELNDKPVMVGGASGRGVVTSASYEARKYGVHSAMPGYQARRLCPQGIFLPGRRRVYSNYSKKVFAILNEYSPSVQALSIDEGRVELTGTERLFGPPLKTAHGLIARLKLELGLPSSGGLSTSKTLAKIAATYAKPHGLIYVSPGQERVFLGPLSVRAIPGVGPKTYKVLLDRGIETIGDLLKDQELEDRFLDLDGAKRAEHSHDHSIGSETTLDQPLRDREKMEEVLWKLVEEVGARLRRQESYARCITVKIRYANFATLTRSRTVTPPTRFDREIYAVARDLLGKNLAHGRPVRLLGVSMSGLQKSGWQESMFDYEKRNSLDNLYHGIDQLRRKYGDEVVGSAKTRDTDR